MEKNTLSAKSSSLLAQIIAAVWVCGWTAFKFITRPELITVTDILFSGLGLAACFMPVYFSIMLDKIKDIKIGGEK